jgi:hypothetical protein
VHELPTEGGLLQLQGLSICCVFCCQSPRSREPKTGARFRPFFFFFLFFLLRCGGSHTSEKYEAKEAVNEINARCAARDIGHRPVGALLKGSNGNNLNVSKLGHFTMVAKPKLSLSLMCRPVSSSSGKGIRSSISDTKFPRLAPPASLSSIFQHKMGVDEDDGKARVGTGTR